MSNLARARPHSAERASKAIHSPRVFAARRQHVLYWHPLDPSHRLCHQRNVTRVCDAAPERYGCHVWAVGFQKQSLQRNAGDHLSELARAREAHHAGEADEKLREAVQQLACQGPRAREAMHVHRVVPWKVLRQQCQGIFLGGSAVNDQRLAQRAGDAELPGEDVALQGAPFVALHLAPCLLVEIVEPALTPSDDLGQRHEVP
mmetsp:Transcript_65293/g.184267  ORF Transcript_65293/g.184267 Transcript_65293/m.184267 type:complete len:203 (+) Transcript_65293:138-746(+)